MGTTLLVTRLKWNNRTYIATALYQEKKILELHLEPDGQQSLSLIHI